MYVRHSPKDASFCLQQVSNPLSGGYTVTGAARLPLRVGAQRNGVTHAQTARVLYQFAGMGGCTGAVIKKGESLGADSADSHVANPVRLRGQVKRAVFPGAAFGALAGQSLCQDNDNNRGLLLDILVFSTHSSPRTARLNSKPVVSGVPAERHCFSPAPARW